MSIVCSNRPSPHLFMRGLDFPYKKRTQIRVKTAKIAIKIGPGSGGTDVRTLSRTVQTAGSDGPASRSDGPS